MWNVQDNTMESGQTMRYGLARSDAGVHTKNAYNQVSSSSLNDLYADEETRKRKAEVLNGNVIVQDAPSLQVASQIVNPVGSSVAMPAAFNQSFGASQFGRVQNDGVFASQNSQSTQANMSTSQADTSSHYSMDAYSASSQALDAGSQKATARNSMPPNLSSREPSSTSTAAVIEIPRLPYSQHFTYKVVGQAAVNNVQSATNNAGNSGNMHGNYISNGELNAQLPAYIFAGNMPLNSPVISPRESTQPRGSTHEMVTEKVNLDTKGHAHSLTDTVHPANSNLSDFARSLNALLRQSNFIVNSSGASEKGETCASSKNVTNPIGLSACMTADACQQESARSGCVSISAESQVIQGIMRNHPAKTNNQVSVGNMGIQISHGAKDETSHNVMDGCNTLSPVQLEPIKTLPKSTFNGESNTTHGFSTLANAGKIWDGTIQLNTSTTVSAVAFFKSGEKSLDLNWPHFIEVKGKVRLEAFEKFTQELPRSRSRALTVTSICWKSGTSETGLSGIKEVSKGYQDGQRVGFAHLSPGTDLYVCPRSETIITILAKYGFFKGMAAVEEDHDSLIGCVVWRRNLTANPISKETDLKKPPLEKTTNSPSDSHLRTTGTNSTSLETKDSKNKSAIMPMVDPTIAPVAQVSSVPAPPEIRSAPPSTHIASCNINSPITGANSASVSVDPTKFLKSITAVPSQSPSNNYFVSPLETCGQIPCTEALISSTTPIKPHGDATYQRAAFDGTVRLPHGSQMASKCSDDDDLPEFDFDKACGAPTSGCHGPLFNRQGNVPAGQGARHPLADGGSLANVVMKSDVPSVQAPCLAIPSYVHQGTKSLVKIAADSLEKSSMAQTIETSHNVAISRETGASAKQVNAPERALWDDDDMPEWCPPDLEHTQWPQSQALPAPSSLPGQQPEFGRRLRMSPPPALPLPRQSTVMTPRFPSPNNRQPFSQGPFLSNAPEPNRGTPGWEPEIQGTYLRSQLPSSTAHFQFERWHSPGHNHANEPNRGMTGRESTRHGAPLPTQLPTSTSRFRFEQGHPSRRNHAAEQTRGAPGREPSDHLPSLPAQLPSSTARFQFELEQRHSPGHNLNNSPVHLRSRFDVKREKRNLEVNYTGTSKRKNIDYESQEPSSSSRSKPRRRPTGFDVLPDGTRLASPHRTRRQPSLSDVKPDSYHSARRR